MPGSTHHSRTAAGARRRVQRPRAFTLVELLIVIGIIGLLVGVLYPALSQAMVMARRTTCATNLHDAGAAMQLYLHEFNQVMPVAAQLPSAHLNEDPPIAKVLKPYLATPEVLRCPSDTERTYFRTEGSSYEYNSALGGCEVGQSFLSRRFGEDVTPVMYDYESFHGQDTKPGSRNYLFADGHVGDLE